MITGCQVCLDCTPTALLTAVRRVLARDHCSDLFADTTPGHETTYVEPKVDYEHMTAMNRLQCLGSGQHTRRMK